MGVNACVYKSIDALANACPGVSFHVVDPATGEAEASGESGPKERFAFKARIGNATEIKLLRDIVGSVQGPSIMMNKVLYSGTHAGDVIAQQDLPRLRKEIERLKTLLPAKLSRFISVMENLLSAAESEHNPIVFL